jgi:hypothetical protein
VGPENESGPGKALTSPKPQAAKLDATKTSPPGNAIQRDADQDQLAIISNAPFADIQKSQGEE